MHHTYQRILNSYRDSSIFLLETEKYLKNLFEQNHTIDQHDHLVFRKFFNDNNTAFADISFEELTEFWPKWWLARYGSRFQTKRNIPNQKKPVTASPVPLWLTIDARARTYQEIGLEGEQAEDIMGPAYIEEFRNRSFNNSTSA